MLIVSTENRDVYHNLAVEEWLLDHAPQLPLLFLCVNDPCVVIGKNQNPWRECRLSLMEKEGVPLARRISGGGAVYHDSGNLNVGVIVPRTEYIEDKQYELIFQCLEKFGIEGSNLGKNSLAVNGLKFSGQAFCFRGQRVLHHGTLLVSADLARLGRYLGPEFDGIETKAVASIPANVANLSQFAPDLTVEKLSAALIETFKEMYALGCGMHDAGCERWADDEIQKYCAATQLLGKNSSKDWKLGNTPRFQVTLDGQPLEIEKGRVVNRPGHLRFEEWLLSR